MANFQICICEKFKPLQSTLPRREDIFSFGQKNRDFSKIEKSRKKQIEKFNLKPENVEYTGTLFVCLFRLFTIFFFPFLR